MFIARVAAAARRAYASAAFSFKVSIRGPREKNKFVTFMTNRKVLFNFTPSKVRNKELVRAVGTRGSEKQNKGTIGPGQTPNLTGSDGLRSVRCVQGCPSHWSVFTLCGSTTITYCRKNKPSPLNP